MFTNELEHEVPVVAVVEATVPDVSSLISRRTGYCPRKNRVWISPLDESFRSQLLVCFVWNGLPLLAPTG